MSMLSSPSVALALRKESLTRALPPCSLPMHTTGDVDMFIGEEGTEDSLSRRPAGAWGDGSPCTCGLDCVPCELHCGLASLACEPEKALACRDSCELPEKDSPPLAPQGAHAAARQEDIAQQHLTAHPAHQIAPPCATAHLRDPAGAALRRAHSPPARWPCAGQPPCRTARGPAPPPPPRACPAAAQGPPTPHPPRARRHPRRRPACRSQARPSPTPPHRIDLHRVECWLKRLARHRTLGFDFADRVIELT